MISLIDRYRAADEKALRQAKEELAESFRTIRNTSAYKFMMTELDKIYAESFKLIDNVDIKDFSLPLAAECRGRRKAIDEIKRKIEQAKGE